MVKLTIPEMTDDEKEKFLEEQKVMRLATLSPNGTIHLVAMWYILIDGDIYFSTVSNSKKARNLSAQSKISIIIDTGEGFELIKGVAIEGRAKPTTDEGIIARYEEKSISKYWGGPDNPILKMMKEMGLKRTLFKIMPDKTRTWDYSKMA
ncbi:MAG: pyridoxamine 5'-phosphate oxidase family protein [Candidatus Hydrothermarchaeaceae archaeon]